MWFGKTKNPRLTGNRGFQKSVLNRLEDELHVAGMPGRAPHRHRSTGALVAGTDFNGHRDIHFTAAIES
ncbi:MAG TPA: hypothetical protein VHB20_00870 [Verrucomicrobiae bacterium]|jgi:hypothetical protein|nr:hypothetical protein [Verrucomicrobiae bacterium]